MSGYRRPFTAEEDRKILRYIFRKNAFYRLRGLEFWKEVNRDILQTRTYQSLHERFRKYIITNIQNTAYDLSVEEQKKLKTIYADLARSKRGKTKTTQRSVPNKDFFELSDSDDSNEGAARETSSITNKSCRNKSTAKRTSNVPSAANTILKNEEMHNNTNGQDEVNSSSLTRVPRDSLIETDSSNSSSDSEIFNFND